ncbi:putative transcriptional regulator [Chishuiella changwenlii]|jgi:putative transcriptional regulator|uniref:Transcriptional regulator n=1 Tax=Chishuiella changwenlii TaxID=1434701 RepID=A0A1M6X100_9FLAO|nr:YqgE/AlgH family protein [Chishuiella changwenlii]GGE98484.1 transcriptional regulator [Chishuiella changwenlii]SHK99561.1 putative transcriptional regulator [Chishuiella changwenlii]
MSIKSIKKGTILVAKPTLTNDIFQRSVVLITEHIDSGSIGFIINRSTNLPISIFVSEVESGALVYEGGPVDKENIYYIHKRPDLIKNSEKIADNVYWSGVYEDVKIAVNQKLIKDNEIKFMIGYCGWSPNQIINELKDNSWEITDLDFDIFENWSSDLWKKLMKQLGGENLIWVNTPADPSMN